MTLSESQLQCLDQVWWDGESFPDELSGQGFRPNTIQSLLDRKLLRFLKGRGTYKITAKGDKELES